MMAWGCLLITGKRDSPNYEFAMSPLVLRQSISAALKGLPRGVSHPLQRILDLTAWHHSDQSGELNTRKMIGEQEENSNSGSLFEELHLMVEIMRRSLLDTFHNSEPVQIVPGLYPTIVGSTGTLVGERLVGLYLPGLSGVQRLVDLSHPFPHPEYRPHLLPHLKPAERGRQLCEEGVIIYPKKQYPTAGYDFSIFGNAAPFLYGGKVKPVVCAIDTSCSGVDNHSVNHADHAQELLHTLRDKAKGLLALQAASLSELGLSVEKDWLQVLVVRSDLPPMEIVRLEVVDGVDLRGAEDWSDVLRLLGFKNAILLDKECVRDFYGGLSGMLLMLEP